MTAINLGMNAKLYVMNTAATPTVPVPYNTALGQWIECPNIKDLTLDISVDSADVTVRGNNGWKASVATLKDATIDFDIISNTQNSDYILLKNAFLSNLRIGVLCLDKDKSTPASAGGDASWNGAGEGLKADMNVVKFSRGEQLAEGIKISVSLKPTYSSNAPTWVTTPQTNNS
jgi:hypothetical protein